MSGPTYRRTWAEWRERNRTGRDAYYDRMEAADQCLATCPVCWTQCDMPEGHLYAHQFEGKCVSRQLSPGYYSASPEVWAAYGPILDRLNKGRLVRTDEPVAIWETVTCTWADFKAAIERATHG